MTTPSYKTYWNEARETLPREQLRAYQLAQLQQHLAWAYDRSPYYRRAFDAYKVKPDDLRSPDDLRRFPFVDKRIERDRVTLEVNGREVVVRYF